MGASAQVRVLEQPKAMIRLRPARPRDLTQLYDCLSGYFRDCAMFYPAPVEKDVVSWGLVVVNQGYSIVAECDGKIIGSVGIERGIYPWNHACFYLNGVWLWVDPERRNGLTGPKLIEAAKAVAAQTNLALRLDEVWKYHPHLMGKLKERKGFHHVGGNYVFIPDDPNRGQAEF